MRDHCNKIPNPQLTIHQEGSLSQGQGGINCCILASGMRGNGEFERKLIASEREKDPSLSLPHSSSSSLYFLFPLSLSSSSFLYLFPLPLSSISFLFFFPLCRTLWVPTLPLLFLFPFPFPSFSFPSFSFPFPSDSKLA